MYQIATAKGPPPYPEGASAQATHFLGRCLELDPKARASARELLVHPFLAGALPAADASIRSVSSQVFDPPSDVKDERDGVQIRLESSEGSKENLSGNAPRAQARQEAQPECGDSLMAELKKVLQRRRMATSSSRFASAKSMTERVSPTLNGSGAPKAVPKNVSPRSMSEPVTPPQAGTPAAGPASRFALAKSMMERLASQPGRGGPSNPSFGTYRCSGTSSSASTSAGTPPQPPPSSSGPEVAAANAAPSASGGCSTSALLNVARLSVPNSAATTMGTSVAEQFCSADSSVCQSVDATSTHASARAPVRERMAPVLKELKVRASSRLKSAAD
ncbi:unnamed protein product [Ostreobium quekettii]|uniref:Protein kinase domain-containing protein n=1 Tax=Ostreobium quekettii TaxID=121088 RepID=A0A8S1JEY8_9CHLO|nr:unnamed protein product [Ostreobium quekettii]